MFTTNREAANLICVSLRSVEMRRNRALQRLDSRAELARFAFSSGMVDWR
jgi:DNA-binding NarL/FixJ family response regulator